MLILGIDTASAQVGVALGGEEGVVAQVRLAQGRRHAEQLAPAVQYVLAEAAVRLSDLAALAVGIGPGLFTGLRVGITTAKVMAQALEIPVIPVASLDLVAYQVRFTDRLIATVADARRGEVYYSLYRSVPGGIQRSGEYRVGPPSDLAAELVATGGDVLLVGDGALRYRQQFAEELDRVEFASPSFAHPSPAALVELACARYGREDFLRPAEVEPLYLRKSDAELSATVVASSRES
ncbi:MAG: tRNA (adenosine(37)-N6)-threonylcarbamoyltransferase complex dimerization subunit type 1 TsaB [Actinobacteria bacterium]|nr:tRNA (adenosine(37)-N6)-threonylcarbamoyltransferase complex dimerization subunit type 1 TsaB [Actinomycetota bacterium]